MSSPCKTIFTFFIFGVLCLGAATQAQAVPVTGILNIVGAVTVNSTTIDFLPPTGGGTGTFTVTLGSTTLALDNFPLVGTTGTIRDVANAPGATNVVGFITFAAEPNIRLDLTNISPGVFSPAPCSSPPAAGQTCTPPGSLFNLVNTSATSSTISASVQGLAFNTATGERSTFNGVFTTQFANMNYQQLLAAISTGGSVTASYSANFTFTPIPTAVPEPATMTLLITGLAGLGAAARKRRKEG